MISQAVPCEKVENKLFRQVFMTNVGDVEGHLARGCQLVDMRVLGSRLRGHSVTTQMLQRSREPFKVLRCSFQYGVAIHHRNARGCGNESLTDQ